MNHFASPQFWDCYNRLPIAVRQLAAVIAIPEGDLLEGGLPPGKMRLVLAWVEIHRDELVADWQLAASGQNPFKIEPLR